MANNFLDKTCICRFLSFLSRNMKIESDSGFIADIVYPKWYSDRAHLILLHSKNIWEVYHTGFFGQRYMIREDGYENPIAGYDISVFKWTDHLKLPDGDELRFCYKMFQHTLDVINERDEIIMYLKHPSIFDRNLVVNYSSSSRHIQKYGWLLPFACYIMLRRTQRRAK